MMFWHLAEALGQKYWMVPVPQAFWMQAEMQASRAALRCVAPCLLRSCLSEPLLIHCTPSLRTPRLPRRHPCHPPVQVPVQEVVDILSSILLPDPAGACAAGSYDAGARASVQGFKAGAEPFVQLAVGGDAQDCQTCRPGTYAFNAGAQRCSTCTPGR